MVEEQKLLTGLKDYKPGFIDATWVRTTGRSWWQAVYVDGKVLSEWDTVDPKTYDPKSTRWEETNRKGLRMLILITPQGKAFRLTSEEDNKFFQLKVGMKTIGTGLRSGSTSETMAHLIGVVINTNGDCVGFSYEPKHMDLVTDSVKKSACPLHSPDPLNADGTWKNPSGMQPMLINADGSCYCSKWVIMPDRALKFEDNVLNMEYHKLGPLGLDSLRLKF
jgi:hypothetical protein